MKHQGKTDPRKTLPGVSSLQGDIAGHMETAGSDEKKSFQSFFRLVTAIRHVIGNDADPSVLIYASTADNKRAD